MEPTQLLNYVLEMAGETGGAVVITTVVMHQLYSRGILRCNQCDNWREKAGQCENALGRLEEREKHLSETIEHLRRRAERTTQSHSN